MAVYVSGGAVFFSHDPVPVIPLESLNTHGYLAVLADHEHPSLLKRFPKGNGTRQQDNTPPQYARVVHERSQEHGSD